MLFGGGMGRRWNDLKKHCAIQFSTRIETLTSVQTLVRQPHVQNGQLLSDSARHIPRKTVKQLAVSIPPHKSQVRSIANQSSI